MKLSSEQRRQVEAIVGELQEILGSNVRADGGAKTFDELEDECAKVGDWLTSQVLERRVAARGTTDPPSCSPDCQQISASLLASWTSPLPTQASKTEAELNQER